MTRILDYINNDGSMVFNEDGKTIHVKTEVSSIDLKLKETETISDWRGIVEVRVNTPFTNNFGHRLVYDSNNKLKYSASVYKDKDGNETESLITKYFG